MMEDLDRLIQAAESGDIQAMATLIQHYFSQKDIPEAKKWAERAVEAGSVVGYYYSMVIHGLEMSVGYLLRRWDELLKNADIVVSRADVLLNAQREGTISLEDSDLNTVISTRNDGLYGGAYAIWAGKMSGDYFQRVIDRLDGVDTMNALTLLGLCCFRKGNVERAFPILKKVYEDKEYRGKKESFFHEAVYVEAMHSLSEIYRLGHPRLVSIDLNKAVEILTTVVNCIEDEDLRGVLQRELNKYHKKLFGGYRYIG